MSNWNYSAWRSKMSIHNHTYSQWSAHNLDLPGSQSLAASGCQCICSKLQWPKASVSSWALHVNCQGKHQGFQKVEYSQQWSCWSFFFKLTLNLKFKHVRIETNTTERQLSRCNSPRCGSIEAGSLKPPTKRTNQSIQGCVIYTERVLLNLNVSFEVGN